MNPETANKILLKSFGNECHNHPTLGFVKNFIYSTEDGREIDKDVDDVDSIFLEGSFTLEELEAIVVWMKNRNLKTE